MDHFGRLRSAIQNNNLSDLNLGPVASVEQLVYLANQPPSLLVTGCAWESDLSQIEGEHLQSAEENIIARMIVDFPKLGLVGLDPTSHTNPTTKLFLCGHCVFINTDGVLKDLAKRFEFNLLSEMGQVLCDTVLSEAESSQLNFDLNMREQLAHGNISMHEYEQLYECQNREPGEFFMNDSPSMPVPRPPQHITFHWNDTDEGAFLYSMFRLIRPPESLVQSWVCLKQSRKRVDRGVEAHEKPEQRRPRWHATPES